MREKLIDILECLGVYEVTANSEQIADRLIANGVTAQRWIPVTERLPEKNGKYLCIYYFGKNKDMKFTSMLDYYATDEVPHFQHTLCQPEMKVTHWMPLPDAPKDGE